MGSGAREGQQGETPFPAAPAESRGHPCCPADILPPWGEGASTGWDPPFPRGRAGARCLPPQPLVFSSAHPRGRSGMGSGWERERGMNGRCFLGWGGRARRLTRPRRRLRVARRRRCPRGAGGGGAGAAAVAGAGVSGGARAAPGRALAAHPRRCRRRCRRRMRGRVSSGRGHARWWRGGRGAERERAAEGEQLRSAGASSSSPPSVGPSTIRSSVLIFSLFHPFSLHSHPCIPSPPIPPSFTPPSFHPSILHPSIPPSLRPSAAPAAEQR